METPNLEHQLEHYLQGHFHPDVAPQVKREIRLGTVSVEGFLRLAELFQDNHDAFDEVNIAQEQSHQLPLSGVDW